MQLFANPKRHDYVDQLRYNDGFLQLMAEYQAKHGLTFFKPSPDDAPWHVQTVIDHGDGEPILINFWPHVGKAQREYCKSVVGWDTARELLDEALAEDTEDEISLIED